MRVEFGKGKRSMHCFMPIADVIFPDAWDITNKLNREITDKDLELIERYKSLRYANHTSYKWLHAVWPLRTEAHLNSHNNTLKGIKRWLKKKKYPNGTIVIVPNWYVGYATVIITK